LKEVAVDMVLHSINTFNASPSAELTLPNAGKEKRASVGIPLNIALNVLNG
jgi:hypothetical protein